MARRKTESSSPGSAVDTSWSLLPLAAPRQERAWGRCFERLLWELSQRPVSRVIVEARSSQQYRTDLRRVDGLRPRAEIHEAMRVSWIPGVKDAMLWAPDIVIGALGDAYVAGADVPAGLREIVTKVRIDLRHTQRPDPTTPRVSWPCLSSSQREGT